MNFRSFPFPISSDVKKEKERRRGREEGRRQKNEKVKGKRKESKWWWPRPGARPRPRPRRRGPCPSQPLVRVCRTAQVGKAPLHSLFGGLSQLSSAQRPFFLPPTPTAICHHSHGSRTEARTNTQTGRPHPPVLGVSPPRPPSLPLSGRATKPKTGFGVGGVSRPPPQGHMV